MFGAVLYARVRHLTMAGANELDPAARSKFSSSATARNWLRIREEETGFPCSASGSASALRRVSSEGGGD